ncbi:Coiled-coil domain-containing protein 8 like pro tein [Micromonospora saelicesensis]|uniref:TetR family transcriptional regulator n=2 Tax=Micromonospora saelicesensis TaxID=285676 RepID=UPI000DC38F66|nr:TetR family transcriptional regulator [Micromonospora saelicesensis]RAO48143.1 Coiled-coil domain-containing protein 8 like pro tein [Micromonospora saelicesensis]
MTADPADDTRTRILRAALDLFAEHGYQRTSLRQIGERLRLTKTAILYHFPAKEHLLAALVEPLLADLETLLDAAQTQPTEQARWTVLEGWVDVILAHRRPLGMLYHDIALVGRGDTYHRLMEVAMRANDLIAGPNAGRRERVLAVQAVGACSDPVVFFTDVPDEVLRADMLDGARRLLAPHPADTAAGPPAGSAAGSRTDAAAGSDADAEAGPRTDAAAGPHIDAAAGPRTDAAAGSDADATLGSATPATPAGAASGAASRRRRPGRPPALGREQVEAARRMHAAGTHSVDAIAAALGVSRATVYRHLTAP